LGRYRRRRRRSRLRLVNAYCVRRRGKSGPADRGSSRRRRQADRQRESGHPRRRPQWRGRQQRNRVPRPRRRQQSLGHRCSGACEVSGVRSAEGKWNVSCSLGAKERNMKKLVLTIAMTAALVGCSNWNRVTPAPLDNVATTAEVKKDLLSDSLTGIDVDSKDGVV